MLIVGKYRHFMSIMDYSTANYGTAFQQDTSSSFTEAKVTSSSEKSTLGGIDIAIVVIYIAVTFGIGIWVSLHGARKSVKRYFLAGRDVMWLPIGASVFVSNIGAGHFVGLAGTGAAAGIAVCSFEWVSIFTIIQMGWVFVPIYITSKVFTMPEYIYKRFGGNRLRVTLSVLSLAIYVLTKIAVDLYAGALFIQQAFNINLYLAIVSLLLITAVYTILGGLKAVIYTDAYQTIVMLIGGTMLMIIAFQKIGGYSNLDSLYQQAIPNTTLQILSSGNHTTCGVPREDAFHLFRDPTTSDHPWPGMLIGIYLMGTYYFCTDQVIVQRLLAAKTVQHAKAGCVLAGSLKITCMYLMVMIGMISRVLFPNEVACADPDECERICENHQGCSNIAYPKLVLEVLPQGLRGIMLAAMLSALMSSLTSIFNSTSTIFTIDVWKRIRKSATEREMLIVGMVTVCIMVVISIAWIPILLSTAGGQLFIYINMVLAPLSPSVTALYLLGVLWPRVNEKGAFWGLISGLTLGVIRLAFDFALPGPGCDQSDERTWFVSKIHYLHFPPIAFAFTCLVMLTISYCTKPLDKKWLINTTWYTKAEIADTCSLHSKTGSAQELEEVKNNDKTVGGSQTSVKVESVQLVQTKGEQIEESILIEIKGENEGGETKCNKEREENANSNCFSKIPESTWNNVTNASAILLAVTVSFLLGFYA